MSKHDKISIQREPKQWHLALQQGRLSDTEIVMAIKHLKEAHFMEARSSVERLLTHSLPVVRFAALHTLLAHWELPEYLGTARYFLFDPDPECREQAIEFLQKVLASTIDMCSLPLLAQIANNGNEIDALRLKAYCALLTIASLPINPAHRREWNALLESGQDFESFPWIDWKLIALLCERWQKQVESTCILLNADFPPLPWHRTIAISKDGNLFAHVSADNYGGSYAIQVWNLSLHRHCSLSTGKPRREVSSLQRDEELDGRVGREPRDLACWSFDGTHLAIAWQVGVLDIWQVTWQEDQECKHVFSYQAGEGFQAFAWGNRSFCFAASTGNELLYWGKPEGTPPKRKVYTSQDAEFPLPGYGLIGALAFSPDDSSLLTGDSEGKIFQWHLNPSRFSFSPGRWWYTRDHMPIVRLAWSPDASRVVVHSIISNESEGIIDQATSIIYLRHNNIFSFGQDNFLDILGWSPDGTLLIVQRGDVMLTRTYIELLNAFTGQLVAGYEMSGQILPVPSREHFTSFHPILSSDGRCIYWCAISYHWLNESTNALQESTWYGYLSLPLARFQSATTPHALHLFLEQRTDQPG
jgi:hypothetical protein